MSLSGWRRQVMWAKTNGTEGARFKSCKAKNPESFAERDPFLFTLLNKPNIKVSKLLILITELYHGGIGIDSACELWLEIRKSLTVLFILCYF